MRKKVLLLAAVMLAALPVFGISLNAYASETSAGEVMTETAGAEEGPAEETVPETAPAYAGEGTMVLAFTPPGNWPGWDVSVEMYSAVSYADMEPVTLSDENGYRAETVLPAGHYYILDVKAEGDSTGNRYPLDASVYEFDVTPDRAAEINITYIGDERIGQVTEAVSEAREQQENLPEGIAEQAEEEPETAGPVRHITVNMTAEFTFDIEEQPIFLVQVQALLGENATGEEDIEVFTLSRDSGFTTTKEIDLRRDWVQFTADVNGDIAKLYEAEFEGLEPAYFYQDKVWNSGILNSLEDGQTYDVKVIFSENPEVTIRDPNDAPDLSSLYDKVNSGYYVESYEAEQETATTTAEETEETTQVPEPEQTETEPSGHINVALVILVVFALLLLLLLLIRYVRKCRSRDDDD